MIPEFKRILYATDLSENARFAFKYAVSLATRYNAGIILLHVMEIANDNVRNQLISYLGEAQWEIFQNEKMNEYRQSIQERLEQFCKDMNNEVDTCSTLTVEDIVIREGHPVDEILSIAQSRDCDLIVMGTHGYGVLTGALIGSTARRVVRRSQIPVFVVRLPDA